MILVGTCIFAALGGFLFGYDLGLIGGALLQIERYFNVSSSTTLELIVGAAKLGAAMGTFLGGAAMARYGRQRALALNSIAFVAGPVLMALAVAPWMLVLGRFVVGIGIGISATVSPAYIAELAPAPIRGSLVQLYEVMLCIGMLSAPLVDWALSRVDPDRSWRAMVGAPAVPALALAAAPLLLPESPRWLVTRNRLDEALHVLTTVMRGSSRLARGTGVPWSTGYTRITDKDCGGRLPADVQADERAVQDAEDELLQLWSGVQLDRNAVLEQRRRLWRSRQLSSGRRQWGRLGRWTGVLGRHKPPTLEPIPEEGSSQLASPSGSGGTASGGGGSGGGGGTVGGRGWSGPPWGRASDEEGGGVGLPEVGPRLAVAAAVTAVAAEGAAAAVGSVGSGRQDRGEGGGTARVGGDAGVFGRASEGWSPGPTLHQVESAAGSSSDLGDGGGLRGDWVPDEPYGGSGKVSGGGGQATAHGYHPLPASQPAVSSGREPGERDRLLAPSESGSRVGGWVLGPGEGSDPTAVPASLALMPGEEPTYLHTLWALLADIGALAVGPERRALFLALGLAFFDQITASTAIINYAPRLLHHVGANKTAGPGPRPGNGKGGGGGVDEGNAMLYTTAVAVSKAVGVVTALLLVDRFGRRPLLISGSLACSAALGALTAAAVTGSAAAVEAAMCSFTLFFSLSWAGLYWVVVSELFSMSAKSAATSAATGLLFLTGAATNLVFLSLEDLLGPFVFLLLAALCLASAAFVSSKLPETKGRTLAEVQRMLAGGLRGWDGAGGQEASGRPGAGAGAGSGQFVELRERAGL